MALVAALLPSAGPALGIRNAAAGIAQTPQTLQ
jgi:hypothetical protein